MKKLIFSFIALVAIVGALYVLIHTPAAAPFLSIFGLVVVLILGGYTIYLRVGGNAERRRNRQVLREEREMNELEAGSSSPAPSPTTPNSLEYPTDQPL